MQAFFCFFAHPHTSYIWFFGWWCFPLYFHHMLNKPPMPNPSFPTTSRFSQHIKLPFAPSPPPPSSSSQPVTRRQHGIYQPKCHFNLCATLSKEPLPGNHVSTLHDLSWKLVIDDECIALIKNKTWSWCFVLPMLILYTPCEFVLTKKILIGIRHVK